MKRFRGPLAFIAVFLVFGAFILWILQADSSAQAKPEVTISVVLYGDDADRWRSLDQGIRQACVELGIEKPALTLAGAGADSQLNYLQREVANGADGLLVAAEDPALAEYLEGLSIPVVAVESGAGTKIPCVQADDSAMARALANLHAGKGKTVAIVAENLHRQNIQVRYNAFFERAAELGQWVMVIDKTGSNLSTEQFIRSAVRIRRPDVLVALDNDTLEKAASALADEPDVKICGIGSSDAVVHALDQGRLEELCFSNEYAIGYIGTLTLAAEMGLGKAPEPVEMQYGIARRETMYRPENERILFPIMQ